MAKSSSGSQLTATIERKFFYRDGMRSSLKVTLASIGLNVILAAMLFWSISNKPEPRYFATNNAGGIIELKALNLPIKTKQGLLTWTSKAVTESYNYDFAKYRDQLQGLSIYYSKKGHEAYIDKLNSNGILDTIKSSQFIVAAVPNGAPVVDAEAVVQGVYSWKVTVPVLVTYTGKESATRKKLVQVIVRRASTLEKPDGLEIDSFVENSAPD